MSKKMNKESNHQSEVLVQQALETIILEIQRYYPNATEVDVAFYHEEDGSGPFIDRLDLTLADEKRAVDYQIAHKVADELDVIRRHGYGDYFIIRVQEKEIK